MRGLLLLGVCFISVLMISRSSGQVLLDENFNYPEGDSLGAHGWVSFSGGNTNVLAVATPGLVYSGYPLSNIGNSCRVRNGGQDAYKQFDSVNSGNIYCSFMVTVDSINSAGDYFFAFLPPNNTSFYTARTYARNDGGLKFGISKSTSPIVYTTGTYTLGQTYLIVVKYTYLTGGSQDDEVRLFVFSGAIPGSEPAPTVGPVTQAINDNTLSRIALRQGTASNAPTLNIDGMRVFRTWGSLVAVWQGSNTAESFSLSQNYPNPFNPSTKIKFSIPEKGYVSLKIYDMLGREVKELVGGSYSRGVYEVDFIAEDLSSGVYVYSIEVNTGPGNIFKDTKKLALIK
jgi:hypothetical protein